MFDPIVFENIKVALENQLYDLDNLDERISIIDRKDILNMAVMSREWSLRFVLRNGEQEVSDVSDNELSFVSAELVLQSDVSDISDEILERSISRPACQLLVRFYCIVENPTEDCPVIEQIIDEYWERGTVPTQQLSQYYGQATQEDKINDLVWRPFFFYNKIELSLNRRIGEEQMNDFEQLIDCVIQTIETLEERFSFA